MMKLANICWKWRKSRETVVLDEDGTMMYVKAVQTLGGSSGWGAGTKPEDYFK